MADRRHKAGPERAGSGKPEYCAAVSDQTRAAAVLAAGVLASRALGLLRDLLTACLLGPAADAFVLAFRLPNFFRRLLAEGSLGMAYAVAEARVLAERGSAAARIFARSVCLRALLLPLPACLLLLPAAPFLTFLLAPGAEADTLARGAELFRIFLSYLPLSLAAAIAFAHAANAGSFLPQAWAPALFNLPVLVCGLAALVLHASPGAAETALCLGVVCGGLAQAALGRRCFTASRLPADPSLFAPASRGEGKAGPLAKTRGRDGQSRPTAAAAKKAAGTRARPALGPAAFVFGPPEVRALLKALPSSALGAAPHQLHILAGMGAASFLAPGGISALYFAERLVELPLGIAGAAVGLAALPHLASLAAAGDMRGLSEALGRSIRMSAFLSLPAAAGLFALALPLSGLLFGHGAYAGEPVAITASALRGYALGLPALCAARPLLAAANALGREREPLKTALGSMGLLILVSAGGMLASASPEKAALSVGAGLAAGAWGNAVLLLGSVGAGLRRAGHGRENVAGLAAVWEHMRGVTGYLPAAGLMALCLCRTERLWENSGGLPLLGLIALLSAAWFGLFFLLKSEDARACLALLRNRG